MLVLWDYGIDMVRLNQGGLRALPLGGEPLGAIANNRFMPPEVTQLASAANADGGIISGGGGDDVLVGKEGPLTVKSLDISSIIGENTGSSQALKNIENFVLGTGKAKKDEATPQYQAYMEAVKEYMKPDEPTGSFASLIGSDPGAAFYYSLLRGGLGAMQAGGQPGATGLSSLGTGLGAGLDQTIALQTKYDAAKAKSKAAKLAAMQAAATAALAERKQGFTETKSKAELGIKLEKLEHGKLGVTIKAINAARGIEELNQKEKHHNERMTLQRDRFAHVKQEAVKKGMVAYWLYPEDGTSDPTVVYIDPKDPKNQKRLEQMERQGYLPHDLAVAHSERLDRQVRTALAQSTYNLNLTKHLHDTHQDDIKNKKPFHMIVQDLDSTDGSGQYIDTKWAVPGSKEAAQLSEQGYNTAEALNLVDKWKVDPKYQILSKMNPDNTYSSRVVNANNERDLKQATMDGYDRTLGPLSPESDGHVMVFDTQDGQIKTYNKKDAGYRQLQERMRDNPSRYQLLSKTRLTETKGISATQRDKLSGQWFTMKNLLTRVNNLSGKVIEQPELVGSSGAALNTLQNVKDSITSLSRAFFGDSANLRIGQKDQSTGKMFTQSDAYEERAMMGQLTDPAAIRKNLSNNIAALREEFNDPNMKITTELVELVQLETELAYALARMQKPSEKINKSDIETFRDTYSLMRLSKGSKTSKVTLMNIGEKLNQGMRDLEQRLGPDFKPGQDIAPTGAKIWNAVTKKWETKN